jgi:bifunctional DNA-binding transcriptional regulator/antitoxin component of YhaV-PrlF toxin-antitoxin module
MVLFQFLERINDNKYKMDLPIEYRIGIGFNVYDFLLFDVDDDSRSNHFEKKKRMITINKYHQMIH